VKHTLYLFRGGQQINKILKKLHDYPETTANDMKDMLKNTPKTYKLFSPPKGSPSTVEIIGKPTLWGMFGPLPDHVIEYIRKNSREVVDYRCEKVAIHADTGNPYVKPIIGKSKDYYFFDEITGNWSCPHTSFQGKAVMLSRDEWDELFMDEDSENNPAFCTSTLPREEASSFSDAAAGMVSGLIYGAGESGQEDKPEKPTPTNPDYYVGLEVCTMHDMLAEQCKTINDLVETTSRLDRTRRSLLMDNAAHLKRNDELERYSTLYKSYLNDNKNDATHERCMTVIRLEKRIADLRIALDDSNKRRDVVQNRNENQSQDIKRLRAQLEDRDASLTEASNVMRKQRDEINTIKSNHRDKVDQLEEDIKMLGGNTVAPYEEGRLVQSEGFSFDINSPREVMKALERLTQDKSKLKSLWENAVEVADTRGRDIISLSTEINRLREKDLAYAFEIKKIKSEHGGVIDEDMAAYGEVIKDLSNEVTTLKEFLKLEKETVARHNNVIRNMAEELVHVNTVVDDLREKCSRMKRKLQERRKIIKLQNARIELLSVGGRF
jgi:uncharacterized coiled-coil DUF342 family protein